MSCAVVGTAGPLLLTLAEEPMARGSGVNSGFITESARALRRPALADTAPPLGRELRREPTEAWLLPEERRDHLRDDADATEFGEPE